MKIERISNTQMKFVLMDYDLAERDIDISKLSHSSEKTQELFKEIMKLAHEEGAFSSDNTPYMIEAMRVGVDCLAIMVTKMDASELERRFSLVPAAKGSCRYKRNNFINQQPDYPDEDSHTVFSFSCLDMASTAANAINPNFSGQSQLYKLNGRFYLWIQNETEDDSTTADLEAVISEFGLKHTTGNLGQQYLAEHGEVVIKAEAVSKLSKYHTN